MRLVGIFTLLATLAVGFVACSGDDAEEATTTTTRASVTTLAGGTTGSTVPGDTGASTTTTTEPGETGTVAIPRYQILTRQTGEDGDTLVILLDPTSYDSLTDIDLRNIVAEVVDEFPPVLEAHLVDSLDAAAVVLADERTPEQEALLEEHYLVRLEEGFRMVFAGPFESVGVSILGS